MENPLFRLGHGFQFAKCKRLPGRVLNSLRSLDCHWQPCWDATGIGHPLCWEFGLGRLAGDIGREMFGRDPATCPAFFVRNATALASAGTWVLTAVWGSPVKDDGMTRQWLVGIPNQVRFFEGLLHSEQPLCRIDSWKLWFYTWKTLAMILRILVEHTCSRQTLRSYESMIGGRGCVLLTSHADSTRRHSASFCNKFGGSIPQVFPHRLDDCRPRKRSLTTVGEAGKTGKVTSHRIDMNWCCICLFSARGNWTSDWTVYKESLILVRKTDNTDRTHGISWTSSLIPYGLQYYNNRIIIELS